MLPKPYFGRVDFRENGTENAEKIMVGLYALPDEDGRLMVYDWRAPVCGLYYDALPGKASYRCPDGVIEGEMTLKRQYSIENGALQYFIDAGESIDDTILLDLLSGAASTHMKQIVSTIQAEQMPPFVPKARVWFRSSAARARVKRRSQCIARHI